MRIKHYINPKLVWRSLSDAFTERGYNRNYNDIIRELETNGRLNTLGIKREGNILLIGVDLNPELLVYEAQSRESVELKMVAERMRKYTDFFQKEGILDSVKADYDRIFNEDYFGYIVSISFNFKRYIKSKYRYDLAYFGVLISSTILGIAYGLSLIL